MPATTASIAAAATPTFAPVDAKTDFTAMERDILDWWNQNDISAKYRRRNNGAPKTYSFIDGPSPPTTLWASITLGGAHTRICSCAFARCKATTSAIRTASTGKGFGSKWKSKKSSASNPSATSRHSAWTSSSTLQRARRPIRRRHHAAVHSARLLDGLDDLYHTKSDENNYTIWHFSKPATKRAGSTKGAM